MLKVEKLSAFLPCRAGSQRILNKNTRRFAHFEYGLLELKVNQLLNCDRIEKVYLSTDDIKIIDYASAINDSKLIIHERNSYLSSSSVSNDALIQHAADLIEDKHILWTHVTSPFVTSELYSKMIERYFVDLGSKCDSLVSVKSLKCYIWNQDGPINYSRKSEKWPKTQDLPSLYEINSACFIAPHTTYEHYKDRIGENPFLYELSGIESIDIDWPDDFMLAEKLYAAP